MNHRWLFSICVAGILVTAACKNEQTKPDEPPTEAATEPASTEPAEETTETEPAADKLPAPPDVAEAPSEAETSSSGLAWIVLEEGEGEAKPTVDSTITVHYTGWTTDGEMFDSSVVREEPIEFPLSQLIKGWQEGIPMMTKGEKRRFWIPGPLAYDESTREGVPKGTLVFDIELIDFELEPTSEAPDVEPKE